MSFPAVLFAEYASGSISRAAFVSRFSSWQGARLKKPLTGWADASGVWVRRGGKSARIAGRGDFVFFEGKAMRLEDFLILAG